MKIKLKKLLRYFLYIKVFLGIIACILLSVDFVYFYYEPDTAIEKLIEIYLQAEWGISADLSNFHGKD